MKTMFMPTQSFPFITWDHHWILAVRKILKSPTQIYKKIQMSGDTYQECYNDLFSQN